MPDIKTRDVVSGTIKAVDRSVLAGQRMKDAYVQAKDKAEHSVYSSESNSEEYASERITDGASAVAREAVHQVDVQGHHIIHGAQKQIAKHQEIRQSQQAAPENLQTPPNTPRTEQTTPNVAFIILTSSIPSKILYAIEIDGVSILTYFDVFAILMPNSDFVADSVYGTSNRTLYHHAG